MSAFAGALLLYPKKSLGIEIIAVGLAKAARVPWNGSADAGGPAFEAIGDGLTKPKVKTLPTDLVDRQQAIGQWWTPQP